jgi:peptidoglycan/LPS O-acetylase OafA/YrhL
MSTVPTTPRRRGAIDVARVGALVMVVLGHLALATIDRGADGALRGANVLALYPDLAWLAMLAPMPVFFAAAGWANATSTPRSAAPRLGSLVGLGAVVVVAWSVASAAEILLGGSGGIVADGGRVATQPLWFLAVYLPFAAYGSTIAGVARRPVVAVGGCLAVLVTLDLARFGYGAPEAVGWPGFFLAWGVAWLLGAWWRERWGRGWEHEQRAGALLVVCGSAVAGGLVLFAGYSPSLIDAVDGQRSNTTPPGVFTAVAAVVQVGLLMVFAGVLDRVAGRARRLFDRAGEMSVAVYVWHLTALALCAAVIAAGLWAPPRFSTAWWITRPLWFAAVLGVTALLAAATERGRRRLRRASPRVAPSAAPTTMRSRARTTTRSTARSTTRIGIGVMIATIGAGVVGRLGPRTLPSATVAAAAFVIGWWLLRPTSGTGGGRRWSVRPTEPVSAGVRRRSAPPALGSRWCSRAPGRRTTRDAPPPASTSRSRSCDRPEPLEPPGSR